MQKFMDNHRGTEANFEWSSINELTDRIIGAAIEVHKALGPGLLESAYESCLGHELSLLNICFERQVPLPIRGHMPDDVEHF